MSELVLLGRISDAHGLKGEVKIATFTAAPEDIAAYGPLSSADGSQHFEIAYLRPLKEGAVIARLRGISGRTAAEKLRGTELYVAREALPPAEDDEYYHSDLIGLTAVSSSGELIGTLIAVHNFGASDLLEVRFPNSAKTELVPFDGTHVPHVDLAAATVTLLLTQEEEEEPEGEQRK
jgi:16S rRNA processing protein RimM